MSYRYDPGESARDLRLDLLRGLCLLKMVFNHAWQTPLHQAQDILGAAGAAEGFFFISGVVAGIVHGRRMHEHGLGPTSRRVLQRAGNLYLANLALVLLFASLCAADLMTPNLYSDLWASGRFDWPTLLTFNQPFYLQVLPRYTAFLLLTPLALWLLRTGRTSWLLLLSSAIWVLAQLPGQLLVVPVIEAYKAADFPLAAWQLLFFTGMAVGYHRRAVAALWQRLPRRWIVPALILIAAGFALLFLRGGPAINAQLARTNLPPGRLLNLAVVFALLFLLCDRLWRPLRRVTGPLLLPFGQHPLPLFLIHIPVIWFSKAALIVLGLRNQLGPWDLLLLDLLLVVVLWAVIRSRTILGLVPA